VQDRSPDEIEGRLKRELGSKEKPFLWVVDDLPTGMDEDTLQRWLAPHPLGKTLITTRTREYDSLGTQIPLDVLKPDEAYDLLISQRRPKGAEEDAAARKVLEDIGYHALAVDVARAALQASISTKNTPFADFINDLAKTTEDELEFASELTDTLPIGHKTSIVGTFLRSIEKMGPDGQDFLRLASMLATAPIPASLVISVLCEADGLSEASGKRRATRAIHSAEKLSLAERVEGDEVAFLVHTLVSRTMRFRDREPKRSGELQNAAVRVLTNDFRKNAGDSKPHHKLEPTIVHARKLVTRDRDIETAELMTWVAQYDYVRGAYKSAEDLMRRDWKIRSRILGDEHPDTLRLLVNLALTLYAQGDFTGARDIQEQMLEKTRRILGVEHQDTLGSMNNLAKTLSVQGDLAGARDIQEQVVEITRHILGDEHLNTLKSMGNLAETLRLQGYLADARDIQEQVLDITHRILGDEHLDTLTSMNNLALTLSAQGDLAGARKIQEQDLEITRRILGDEHPDTLTSMNNLAATLQAQGDLAGTRKLKEQVLKIRQQILGEEHHDTITSMGNLAATLQAQGDLAAAQELQEQVVEIRWRILGKNHPDTLRSMNNLAQTLLYLGEIERAREIQEEVLDISWLILGDKHPNTSMSAWVLFCTYDAMGDFVGAKTVLESDLLWLLDRDPTSLGAYQQEIREMILQIREKP